jgi:hypothetical protein
LRSCGAVSLLCAKYVKKILFMQPVIVYSVWDFVMFCKV